MDCMACIDYDFLFAFSLLMIHSSHDDSISLPDGRVDGRDDYIVQYMDIPYYLAFHSLVDSR